MTLRAKNIIGWTLSIIISLFMFSSVIPKFIVAADSPTAAIMIADGYWEIRIALAIIELICIVLFLWPRTSTIGFIFMVGYWSGALATALTHGHTLVESFPLVITMVVLTICGYIRFPELTARLKRAH